MLRQFIAMTLACCFLASETVAQQPAPIDGWRSVSSRSVGDLLKIKRKDGSVLMGRFKSASEAGLVLEQKNKEISLSREEIASVAVLAKKSAAKATMIGLAVGGGAGAGVGAGIGASLNGRGFFTRGQAAGFCAAVFGGIGAAAGTLIGFATGHASHRETSIYQDLPAR